MGIFDPKTDTSVAYEQPVGQGVVEPASAGMALAGVGADLATGFLKSYAQNNSGSGGGDNDAWAKNEFQNTLAKANAARTGGKPELAERIERVALLNAQKNGLSYNEDMKATYSAITGRQGEELLYSQEEIMENRIMDTAEYEQAYTASYAMKPNMSAEERHQYSISTVARQQGQAAMMMDQSISWTQGKRDAFFSAVDDFESAAIGSLNLQAQANGFADLTQLRTARAQWEQAKGAFASMRPEGVEDKQWSQFEARMAKVDEQFATLEAMSTEEGISALAAAEVARGIASKEDWSPGLKVIAKQYFKDGLATGAIDPSKVRDMVGDLIYDDFEPSSGTSDTIDEQGNPVTELVPKAVADTLSGEDAGRSFDRAKNTAMLTSAGDVNKVESDPAYRMDFFKTTQIGFAAMRKIGKENRRFVTADGISEVFNGKIVEGLRRAGKGDPVRALATTNIAVEALDEQFAIASGQLNGSLQGSVLRLDPQGNLVLNRDELLARTSPEVFAEIEAAAEESYNGSLLALLKDRGMKPRLIEMEGGGFRQATAVRLPNEVYEGLGDLDVIQSQLRSVKAISNKRNEFIGLRDEFSTEGAEDSGVLATEAVASTQVRGYDLIKDDTEFLSKTNEVANDLNINPVDLLQAISFETIGTFRTDIKNPGSTATGLIQFLSKTAKGLGTSTEALAQMNRVEQMDFVKKYLEPYKGRLNNLGDIYMAIHWPAGIGKDSSYVMYERGSDEYVANSGLDSNKDGTITRGEAVGAVIRSNKGGSEAAGVPQVQTSPISEDVGTPTTRRSQGLDEASVADIGGGAGNAMPSSAPVSTDMPQGQPTASAEATEQSSEESAASSEENRETGRAVNEQQEAKVQRLLKRFDVDPTSVPRFTSVQDAQKAIDDGTLKDGDLYVLDGEIEVVEGA